jgi:hypothetical protein
MTAIMFVNLPTSLRSLLDALVSAWMRQTAAAAESACPRAPDHR